MLAGSFRGNMLIFHATQYEIIIKWFSTKIYDNIYNVEKIAIEKGIVKLGERYSTH